MLNWKVIITGIVLVVNAHLMVVNLKAVPMVSGIVVMASVSQKAMFVMAQVNSVTLDGVLTVLMAQMKA